MLRNSVEYSLNRSEHRIVLLRSGRLRPKDVVEVVNAALETAGRDYGLMVRTILCDVTPYSKLEWNRVHSGYILARARPLY